MPEKPNAQLPEKFTPEWNRLRADFFAACAKVQRSRGVEWSKRDRAISRAALGLVVVEPGMLGHEEAKAAYESLSPKSENPWPGKTQPDPGIAF